MKITAIELTPFDIGLTHPISFATGKLDAAQHVLVQVRTDEGVIGTAEAIPRPMVYGETRQSVLAAIEQLVAPCVLGRDALELEHLPDRLANVVANPAAKSAVELAILDAVGQLLGVPGHCLLGAPADASVRCTVLLGWGRPEDIAQQAVDARERLGVTAFKLKVGIDLPTDIATATTVRRRIGPDALLYADANHGFSPIDATRFLRDTEEAGLAWLEEPCPAAAVLARQRLCAASPIPIVGDESCADLGAVAAEVLSGRSTMVSIKLARTGAVTTRRIVDFCLATGVDVVVGSQGDSAIGTLAAAALAAALPHAGRHPAELLYFLDLEDDLVVERPTIVDGHLRLTDAPGFGIVLDQHRVARRATGPTVVVS